MANGLGGEGRSPYNDIVVVVGIVVCLAVGLLAAQINPVQDWHRRRNAFRSAVKACRRRNAPHKLGVPRAAAATAAHADCGLAPDGVGVHELQGKCFAGASCSASSAAH